MRKLLVPFAVLFAGAAAAEEPVTLAWKATEGAKWTLTVVSERRTEVQSGKQPLETKFRITITGELRFGAPGADGSRDCDFTFATLEGTIEALGVKLPLAEDPKAAADKTVKGKLGATGRVSWDEKKLHEIAEGFDLSPDFADLFPVLPSAPVALKEEWKAEVDRRTDTFVLKGVEVKGETTLASFSGTSKADESSGDAELRSTLRVSGTLTGEWNVSTGCLASFQEERSEEAKIVRKNSILVSKSDVKRQVTLEPKK
jgi:hypothetical protein